MAAAFAANRDPIVQRPEQMPKPALMSRSAISPKNTRNWYSAYCQSFLD